MVHLAGKRDIVEEARSGKRLFNAVFVLLAAVLIFAIFMFLNSLVIPLLLFKFTDARIPENLYGLFNFVVSLFAFILMPLMAYPFIRFAEGRKFRTIGFHSEYWFRNYVTGVGLGLLMMGSVVFILALFGCISLENPVSQPTGFQATVPLLILFLGFAVQSAGEEIMSRGWLLNAISAKHNRVLGVVLSSLFFIGCHSLNSGIGPMVYLNATLFAVFLCMYVFRTNNLWGACGFHAMWNFALGNVFGFDVSGVPMNYGTVVDLNVHGNSLLTGGQFGLEAGIPASAVLLLGIFTLVLTGRSRAKTVKA